MAKVAHVRTTLVLDMVLLTDDDQNRLYWSWLRKARAGAAALRVVVRDDNTVWIEQQQQDSSGSHWWPVCRVHTLSCEVTQ